MFLHILNAEWTKLVTTRSFWWTTVLFLFFGLGWAAVVGNVTLEAEGGIPTLLPGITVVAVYLVGFTVLMIQAIMVITTEYRYGLQGATYLATPRRWMVVSAKLLLYAVVALALTFVTVFLCFYVAKFMAPPLAGELFTPLSDDTARRILWVYPAATVLLVLFSQGIALLLRQTAGSVALVLIWFMGLESVFLLIPEVGSDIVRYLPFENLTAFVNDSPIDDLGWGAVGSGLYFLAWAAVLWVGGLFVLERRDA